MPRIVITDFIADDLAPERSVLGPQVEIAALNAYTEAELVGKIETANCVLLYHNLALTKATISRLARCKLIVRCGVGIDNVDRAFARQQGIAVCNVPDYGTEDVADTAIGMILALTRGINLYNTVLRDPGPCWMYTHSVPLRRMRGLTVGIIGLGRIGTATALRAVALGCRVLFYDPYLPDGVDKSLGISRVETLAELLNQAAIVSLHCPLTAENRHMIGAEQIAMLPHGAYLINTARGALVDTAAIPAALASGQLAGAALDVLPQEPPSSDDPLLRAWRDPRHPAHCRLIINPHAAFYSEEGLLDMRVKGAEACRRALAGLPLRNVVN
jgi:D-3-phosphoglycerate dehydrogenase/C-terminal binding protein